MLTGFLPVRVRGRSLRNVVSDHNGNYSIDFNYAAWRSVQQPLTVAFMLAVLIAIPITANKLSGGESPLHSCCHRWRADICPVVSIQACR